MSQSQINSDPELTTGTSPSTPRWVKLFGIMALGIVLLLGIMLLAGGEHSPSRHLQPTNITVESTEPVSGHTPPIQHGG